MKAEAFGASRSMASASVNLEQLILGTSTAVRVAKERISMIDGVVVKGAHIALMCWSKHFTAMPSQHGEL